MAGTTAEGMRAALRAAITDRDSAAYVEGMEALLETEEGPGWATEGLAEDDLEWTSRHMHLRTTEDGRVVMSLRVLD